MFGVRTAADARRRVVEWVSIEVLQDEMRARDYQESHFCTTITEHSPSCGCPYAKEKGRTPRGDVPAGKAPKNFFDAMSKIDDL